MTRGWTEGKPWEIAWGEVRGEGTDGTDDWVDGEEALPVLFPTVSLPSPLSSLPSRSFPTELSPSYFPWLPPRPPPSRSFPPELSPSYFPRFPLRPPYRRFHLAPSPRSSPQAISHGSISLLPNGALPVLFPTVSLPSTLSSLPYRPFPTELSRSYFPRDFLSVHLVVASLSLLLSLCYFPRFPVRPPCHHFRIAPSQRKRRQGRGKGK